MSVLNKIKEACYIVAGLTNKTAKADKYELLFEDDFQSKTINPDIWSKVERTTSNWRKYASMDDEMFEFTDNGLKLKAWKWGDEIKTCGITTQEKVHVAAGKVEVVARMATCPHCWHAIWLYGEHNISGIQEPEVDISECFHNKPFTYQTVHTAHLHKTKGNGHTTRGFLTPEKWNTFACEWDTRSVRMYINGTMTTEWSLKNDVDDEFCDSSNPLKLIISAQLGGSSWPGEPTEDCLDTFIEVKNVKFWRALI